ncbi:murein biosynthesis integral membrane protein MurJ [Histidinibacterium aquaticum]|uniref:Probable lipid II flippase MurJ n=1 Tax=Histidinibacterium aquaticum TaxID=2613962 RepID=A0A5J5GCN9_9RHOB|nr:murein biosynthesis integral membrane protein MurJ [Histidinibacterium aquaticum]KAA9005194.1 murein biosynthesis integral membrane protein MurJ [Histidinibacterium aquaticum]
MKPIRLIAGFLTVGVWTLLSRVLGFARDILIAGILGTGPVAEAFFVAFALPNMFRRFFAEGAFNMAFVPMFSKKVESGGDAEGFARDALSGLATILIGLTVVALVFMPFLVLAMAGGFAADNRLEIATVFGRIVFPYILLISMAALLSGVLNALGRFAAAAAAPVILNVILVGALWYATGAPESVGPEGFEAAGLAEGYILSWGVLVAGVAQLALVWVAARRAGITVIPRRPRLTPEMKRLARIAAPAALAGGVVQVNLLVGRQVASFFDGAIAWLAYADRLYQLPLGVVGIAVGIVLLPDLSRRIAAQDSIGGQNAFNRACEFSLALTVPAAIALIVIPGPIVGVLFQRGAFDASDTAATALAVAIYGAGLPAFVLQKALQPLFFAREDTRRPFYYALVSMVVNAVVAIGLAPVIGFTAAAWGTTLAGWALVVLLALGARKRLGEAATIDPRLRRRVPPIVLSAALMGAVLWAAAWAGAPLLESGSSRYAALAGLVGLGIVVYFAAAQVTGAMRLAELKGAMRRG